MTERLTAAAETPIYLDTPNGPILALVTSAPGVVGDVVVFSGGWLGGNSNANRVIVRLARTLAARALAVVRFDWVGAGESPGFLQTFRLDDPGIDEGRAAVELACRDTSRPVSLVGVCIGTRAALAVAMGVDRLESLALVSIPLPAARNKLRQTQRIGLLYALRQGVRVSNLRGWLQPPTRRVYRKFLILKWQSLVRKIRPSARLRQSAYATRRIETGERDLHALLRDLRRLVERGVRVLLLFGTDDAAYRDFVAAKDGPLGTLLERYAGLIEVREVDGDLSGFSTLAAQQTCIDNVTEWLVAAR